MAVTAKRAKFKRELKKLEEQKKNPDKKVLLPRERIQVLRPSCQASVAEVVRNEWRYATSRDRSVMLLLYG